MSEEENKVFETFKKGYGLTKAEKEILSNLIERQQKEIEEIKYKYEKAMEMNKCLYQFDNKASIDKFYISKYKIRELLKSKDIELTGVISYRELEELL